LEKSESKLITQENPNDFWPPPIESHSAIIDTERKVMVIYGGCVKYTETSDVFEYSMTTGKWTKPEIKAPLPDGRMGHTATFFNNKMYIFGGISSEGNLLSDIWELDLKTYQWAELKSGKPEIPPVKSFLFKIYREYMGIQLLFLRIT
jgi:N-acetylneuraminic acid mutarotase